MFALIDKITRIIEGFNDIGFAGLPEDKEQIEITVAQKQEYYSTMDLPDVIDCLIADGNIQPVCFSEEMKRDNAKDQLKQLRIELMANFILKLDDVKYNFSDQSKNNFAFKTLFLPENATLKWDGFNNQEYILTKAQALKLIELGDAYISSVHQAAKDDKKAIESGDYSLSSLLAVKQANEDLNND